MVGRPAGVLQQPPAGLSTWAVIRFFPDYTAEHPLWLADGLADLDRLHLPEGLTSRLRTWADSWEAHCHWDSGWAIGHPESWWVEEEARLPRDLATALGADFAVAVKEGFIHSRAPASCPAAATAMAGYVREREERLRDAQAHPGRYRWSAD